jgi:hypothetical protein
MKYLGRALISANYHSGQKQHTFHGTEDIKAEQLKVVPQSDFGN